MLYDLNFEKTGLGHKLWVLTNGSGQKLWFTKGTFNPNKL